MASPSDSDGRSAQYRKLAAQNGLARFLQVRKALDGVNVMVPYHMMKDVEAYPQWMPLCTGGVSTERGLDGETTQCRVAVGLETGTFLGTLGDNVSYSMTLVPPRQVSRGQAQARVVFDTGSAGFAYGERIVYDWAFTMTETFPGKYKTLVSLDLFIQVKASPYAMIWDAVQQPLTGRMLRAIEERAQSLAGAVPDFELQAVPPEVSAGNELSEAHVE